MSIFRFSKKCFILHLSSIIFLIIFLPTQLVHALGKQEETYSIVLENPIDYASLALQQAIIEAAKEYNMELYVNNTNAKSESKGIIDSAIANKAPVITYQPKTQENLSALVNEAKNKVTSSRDRYFTSFIFLTTPLPPNSQFNLPWAFVGLNTKDIVKNLLIKIANKNINKISVYTPKLYAACEQSTKKETESNTTIIKTNTLDYGKENTIPQNPVYSKSLAHSVFSEFKKVNNSSNEVQIMCYDRKEAYLTTLKNLEKGIQNQAIITLNDEVAIGVVKAYEEKNITLPLIVGFGGSPEIKRYISEKKVLLSIVPNYEMYAKKILEVSEIFFFTYAGVKYSQSDTTFKGLQKHFIPFSLIE